MTKCIQRRVRGRRRSERGMSLLELMAALLITVIGLTAITQLLILAIATNNRNARDTTATLLAQKVIEQIAAINPATPNDITVTDCAGNAHTISTTEGAAPAGAGADLVTNAGSKYYGGIDQTQNFGNIPADYSMLYVDCSDQGGVRTTYEVRWNIMTLRAGSTRLITASARPAASNAGLLGGRRFAIPVNLRTIGATP